MPEQRRRCGPQFKAEAVQLVVETGRPIGVDGCRRVTAALNRQGPRCSVGLVAERMPGAVCRRASPGRTSARRPRCISSRHRPWWRRRGMAALRVVGRPPVDARPAMSRVEVQLSTRPRFI